MTLTNKKHYFLSQSPIFMGMNIVIFAIAMLIGCIGILELYSAGGGLRPWAIKHIYTLVLCIVIILTVAKINYMFWMYLSPLFYIVFICILVLMHFHIVGSESGVNRWLRVFGVSFQPSELMKIAVYLLLARMFYKKEKAQTPFYRQLLLFAVYVGVPAVIIFLQPDLGTSLLLMLSSFAILHCSRMSFTWYIFGFVVFVIAVPCLWLSMKDYQKDRIISFFSPDTDVKGNGYHIAQSRIAIGSGGMIGKGYMKGTQNNLGFLPVKESDFIFTVICEEFGFIGGACVILLYMLYVSIGLYMAILSYKNIFASLFLVGLSFNIFSYVFVNCAMTMGMLPVVGVPLPFISAGGTSAVIFAFTTGIMMAIYSQHIMDNK